VLDELAERLAELFLALRHDRRVRDGNPERVPEQGDDGEPVGEPADHRRLEHRPDVLDPRLVVGQGEADDVQHRGEHEQAGGLATVGGEASGSGLLRTRLGEGGDGHAAMPTPRQRSDAGSSIVNVVPSPDCELQTIDPPIRSVRPLAIASPRPVPSEPDRRSLPR
jgi:hypothetical protein